jgi:hypothetical protein
MERPMPNSAIGEVRPSQLLWTYGPGALIDLPNKSVVTLGIDRWERETCELIIESRLLASVKARLGAQVAHLRLPPVDPGNGGLIGVPVKPFPRWMRCVKCGLLSPWDAGIFELQGNPRYPASMRFAHAGCDRVPTGRRAPDVVPARFLMACRNGHLDDFPWHWFVHKGPSDCPGSLSFFESGASLQTENIMVKCNEPNCGASRPMAQAFGQPGETALPACRGRHPHLDHFEEDGCEQPGRAVLLGASNGWFPVTLSALAIPQFGDPLSQIVADGWGLLSSVQDEAVLDAVVTALKNAGQLPGIERFSMEEIWLAIERHRSGAQEEEAQDLKAPEWAVLSADPLPTGHEDFLTKVVPTPQAFDRLFKRVVLLERLREVNALIGFTRIEAPDEGGGGDAAERAPIGRGSIDWVPANQVRGEGIFIEFKRDVLAAWEKKPEVQAVLEGLLAGHRGWRNRRGLDPNEKFPGIRFIMLHTVAHVLIRELALECGYNAASIRERIYAVTEDGEDQAGILIYTAAADSDGTLGGLVDLGNPENLGPIIQQALRRAQICASDPLCSEHDAKTDQSTSGAACHACSLVSETSCEVGNRYLDRSLIVETVDNKKAAFFEVDG